MYIEKPYDQLDSVKKFLEQTMSIVFVRLECNLVYMINIKIRCSKHIFCTVCYIVHRVLIKYMFYSS